MLKEIYKTLRSNERTKLISISFFTLISLVFELFGITLIIPISKLILDPEFYGQLINDYSYLSIIQYLDREKLIIFIIILFFLTVFFKTIFFTILSYKKFSFINNIIKSRTLELYDIYLKQNITFFKKTHSASLVKNLINEMFVLGALFNSIIILFSELIFTLLIVSALFIFNFQILFFLLIYSLIIYLLYKIIIKNKIFNWGNERQVLQADITKDFMESFGAIKELIVYNKTDLFKDKIKSLINNKANLDTKFATVNEIPKYFLELLSLLGFSIILTSLYLIGIEKNELLITLIFFGALIFKALPSFSRIITSFQQIGFSYPANKLVNDEINRKNDVDLFYDEEIIFNESIKFKNLSFSFEENKILNNFSIEIKKGERALIIGESGKGKSTLIDIIAGFYNNYEGDFLIDGVPLKSIVNWRKKIGYLSQSFFILDDSIKNNIILNDESNEDRLIEIIKICQLTELISSKKEGLNTVIGERGSLLSGGEKQRIGLARALYRNPEILILDEPTSSLDDNTAENFIESVLKLDKNYTIIMVTHNSKFQSLFERIIKIT